MPDAQDFQTTRLRAARLGAVHFNALDELQQGRLARWLADEVGYLGVTGARSLLTALADYCEFTPRGQSLARALQGGAE